MKSPMTPQEFKRALTALDLSLVDAATLLAVTTRAVRYWLDGERKVPWPVVRFLAYLQATGVSGDRAIERLRSR